MREFPASIENWVAYQFREPGSELDSWEFSEVNPWVLDAEQTVPCLTQVLENGQYHLGEIDEAIVDTWLWEAIGTSTEVYAILSSEIPWPLRERAIQGMGTFFREFLASRCLQALGHRDEKPCAPLNSICYMWWDVFPTWGEPRILEQGEADRQLLAVMANQLEVPHIAVQESALHGLGHWQMHYPEVSDVIDSWLERELDLRPELVSYARQARAGMVL